MENMNDDLISRQDTIKYLMTNMNWYDEDGYESDDDYKRECITELISGVPPAQPEDKCGECDAWNVYKNYPRQPEIIRCKDCKHYQFADNRAFGMQVKMCKWFGFEDVDDEDFCSRAERREDG